MQNKKLLIILANVAMVLASALAFVVLTTTREAVGNELAVGTYAKVRSPLAVAINKPVDLNYKLRDDVLNMRKEMVAKQPQLLLGSYEPDMDIFEHMEDKRPWWGTGGQAVYGPGENSTIGPSGQSRFILNPFLLVGIDSATNRIWNEAKITEQDLNNPDFPFYWEPDSLQYDPPLKRAIVNYNVTNYYKQINASGKLLRPTFIRLFSLVAYNARDFGYHYMYVDLKKSINIQNVQERPEPIKIRQFIHNGGSCGFPGGCNNVSPEIYETDRISFKELPARLVVDLWRQRPNSVEDAPDFMMIIDLH